MNILLVEDEDPKRRNILNTLRRAASDAAVSEARSVNSALKMLRESAFDLVLLDMSLPSFDIGPGEGGGRPLGFGGIELLRSMDRFGLRVPVIVITAYDQFSSGGTQISLDALSDDLGKSHPLTFRGLVFYNSVVNSWIEQLRHLIEGAMKGK